MDTSRRVRALIFNSLTILLALGVLGFLVWSLRPLILPITLGVLFAYLFRPLKTAFKYRWLPNGLRVVLLFVAISGSLLTTVKFVKNNIPSEKEQLEILVRMKYKFNEKFDKFMGIDPQTGKGNSFYDLLSQDLNPLRKSINENLALSPEQREIFVGFYNDGEISDKYFDYFLANTKQQKEIAAKIKSEGRKVASVESAAVAQPENTFLKTVVGVLSIWFLFPIVFVCFLFDDGTISRFFISMVPNRYFELVLTIQEEVDNSIGKYLRGISMECGLVGLTMAVGLLGVGVPVKIALLIAILTGFTTAIPFLAPIVGLGFGMTYALIAEEISPVIPMINMDNLPVAVLVVVGIVIVLDNIVFQPIVLGSAVNLHPLVVILGIMAASMLFGMAGVLLAIPTIVVLKAVIQQTFRGLKAYRII